MMKKHILNAAAILAVATMFAADTSAQEPLPNHLFQQYTTQGANQVDAGLYPAPHPVPSWVGSSAYTYQPLMPHEMMYSHSRNYYNYVGGPDQYYRDCYGSRQYQGGSGINITKVRWQSGSNAYLPLPFSQAPFAPLHYRWAKHRYMTPRAVQGFHTGGGCQTGNCGNVAPVSGCSGGCATAPQTTTVK